MILLQLDTLQGYDDSGWFWIDPSVNTLKEYTTNELTRVGQAYMRPYHLDKYKPRHLM